MFISVNGAEDTYLFFVTFGTCDYPPTLKICSFSLFTSDESGTAEMVSFSSNFTVFYVFISINIAQDSYL